jgi:hypothetical protein
MNILLITMNILLITPPPAVNAGAARAGGQSRWCGSRLRLPFASSRQMDPAGPAPAWPCAPGASPLVVPGCHRWARCRRRRTGGQWEPAGSPSRLVPCSQEVTISPAGSNRTGSRPSTRVPWHPVRVTPAQACRYSGAAQLARCKISRTSSPARPRTRPPADPRSGGLALVSRIEACRTEIDLENETVTSV